MDAIEYFKGMRERLCESYLKIIPKDSVGYQATLIEKSFYDEAIKALERKPCEDSISRQTLKDLGAECIAKRDENGNLIALGSIDSLPPVTPQPKIGCWIQRIRMRFSTGEIICSECSVCGEREDGCVERMKFCPNCGAKMEVVEE